jgi:hypothetical protein
VPNLAHRHSAVRLAVLKAADALVLAGAADAVVIETVVPAVRKLVTDHTPAVRSAAVGTLAGWMLHASSTARTTAAAGATDAPALLAFPTQLLPLLLLAVKDDNAELATKALATAEQVWPPASLESFCLAFGEFTALGIDCGEILVTLLTRRAL